MKAILEVQELCKYYDKTIAVNNISFTVSEGICLGLLGPNGAGKTTTVEMIEGIKEPSSGDILYRGEKRDKTFSQVAGIQFQSTAMFSFLTVKETLKLFHSLYAHTSSIEQLIETCDLHDFIDKYTTKISGGQKQRLLLALALINNPDIVFLDEPTTGLDPQSRRHFWQVIKQIKQQGKTILLTTHYMEEAEYLCDQLLIIDKGQVIAEGSPEHLLKSHFNYNYICLDASLKTQTQLEELGVKFVMGDQIEIYSNNIEFTLQQLIQHNINLNSLRVRSPTLEDLFIKLTGSTLRD